MEEQQLSVDDDLLPIYYSGSHLGTGTLSGVWQKHAFTSSVPQPNLLPLLDHKHLAVTPPDTGASMLDKHSHKNKEQNQDVAFISGTKFKDHIVDDHSHVQKEMFHEPQLPALPKSTNPMASSSSAQDVIMASLLQVQLCVLDLQDQIDLSENCRLRDREQRPETGPLHTAGDVPQEENHQELEEDQEIDDLSYSELEDEHLFCDNPLFTNSQSSHPAASFPELDSEDERYKAEAEGSHLLLAQNVWDSNVNGTGKAVWHEMASEESLEELQIYEDEWEERATKARKWNLSDLCMQKTSLCSADPGDIACNSTPIVPEAAPFQEMAAEEEGLLFSEPGIWSQLLIEDEESIDHFTQTTLEGPSPLQSPASDESGEETILMMPCYDQSMPVDDQVDGIHMLCLGCQDKEDLGRRLSSEDATEELNVKSHFPESVVNQLDDVSADLETSGSEEVTYVEAVSISQDAEAARCLAMKLFNLDGYQRSQVAAYLQKNNDFSAMVAEEYLALFDFTGKSLDVALRSLLQELVLTGETQERERVLFHFSKRFHNCNPKVFSSPDAVHTLTCALMLLNSDLHGQNIGKSMTAQEFINNLDGMNDGANFPRELLKSMYHAIRVEKLEWAISEEKLSNALISRPDSLLSIRKKSSPFIDIPPPDPQAPIYKQGMLSRKVHAYIDGKKTPWGKRGWKSFHTALKGMLLFFLKDEYRADFQCPEEVISVHHSLAEKATDYNKRPNVFRLQTADWRVFLFQAQTSEEMNSWISRINLVAAMFSSPPFPAAVGSQKRFYRPILPSSQCKLDLEEQLQSHETLMDRFTDDLTEHQRNLPDSKSKTRDWEDYHLREEYLRYEKLRYETYVKLLAIRMESGYDDLHAFESRLTDTDGGQEESNGLKRSYSSPSLNPDNFPVAIKVKRNISERRTYRRIIPKRIKT